MKPFFTKNRTIGLLGGSFNPAHGGHLHITLYALHKLHFDEVWWLVSPHNPLKSAENLADYGQRLQSAMAIAAHHPRIRVLDIEAKIGTRYTYEIVKFLKAHYPGTRFVWMMGADNLAQFHRWRRWKTVLSSMPVTVFDRAPYSHTSLRSKTMLRGRKFLLKATDMDQKKVAPWLFFVHLKKSPLSSTGLRKKI